MYGMNSSPNYDIPNMLPKQALHRLYLEYPFAKGKAYKVELCRNSGYMAIVVRNKKTNEYVGSTIIKGSDM